MVKGTGERISSGRGSGGVFLVDGQTFPGVYRCYFENQNGEQAIFLYDYDQERGMLYMGDAGWEHPYDVVDAKVPELILNHPEHLPFKTVAVDALASPSPDASTAAPLATRGTSSTTEHENLYHLRTGLPT